MANNVLEFYFRLIDQATAPARRVTRSLEMVSRAAKGVERPAVAYRFFRQELGLSTGAARTLTSALYAVSAARSGLGGVVARFHELRDAARVASGQVMNLRNILIAGAAGYTIKLGLDIAAQKETLMTAFRVLAPGQERILLKQAVQFAAATPFETGDVIDAYQRLLTAGFKPVEIPVVLAGVGDLAALKGFDKGVIDRVLYAIQQIRAKGRLQGEELMQLAEAGVPLGKVYEVLGQRLGQSVEQVQKLQEAGRISPDVGIWAVLEALRTTVSGGKLGNLMQQQSRTVRGMISTLRSRPFELLMDVDTTPGFASVRRFLSNLVDATDTASATGRRLKRRLEAAFSGLLSAIFGPLARSTEPRDLEKVFDRLLDGMDRMALYIQRVRSLVVDFARGIGDAIRTVWGIARAVWGAIAPVLNWVAGLRRAQSAHAGVSASGARLIGLLFGLVAATRVLNLLTLGLVGNLGRLALAMGTRLAPAVSRLGFSLLRLGAAWLVGLGPVGWAILGVSAIGTALAWLWARSERFRNSVLGLWQSVSAFGASAVNAVASWVGGVVDRVRSLPAQLAELGRQAWTGFVQGLQGAAAQLWGNVTRTLTAPLDWIKDRLGIRSPSRVFEYLGRMTASGFAQGIRRATPLAVASLAGLAQFEPPVLQPVWTQPVWTQPVLAQPEVPMPPAPRIPALRSPDQGRGVSVVLQPGAIVVRADGDPAAIAKAVREELVRLAMEVGHV